MHRTLLLTAAALACGCLGDPSGTAGSAAPLSIPVTCVEPDVAPPAGALACGTDVTLECGQRVNAIYVNGHAGTCAGAVYSAPAPPAWSPGVWDVTVYDRALEPACVSRVTVVDRRPPVATGRTLALWPPNHRLEAVRASDCVDVRDACDAAPRAFFTWGAVDEADDARGDGSTAGDLSFASCGEARVRAERSGRGDGRVYAFGVRVVDASGNATDAVCRVVVAHDQSGRAAASTTPARRVPAPAGCR